MTSTITVTITITRTSGFEKFLFRGLRAFGGQVAGGLEAWPRLAHQRHKRIQALHSSFHFIFHYPNITPIYYNIPEYN